MSPVHCNVLSIQLGSASAKRYLKTAGLCGIALFVDVGSIHGHQTVYEIWNLNIEDKYPKSAI